MTRVYRLPLDVGNFAKRLASGSLRGGDISGFFDLESRTRSTVPLVSSAASCGFPSPADDYLDRALDFNELLIKNPAATFTVRISGESMTGAGLYPGDIAIVDRSLNPTSGSIVLARTPASSPSSGIDHFARDNVLYHAGSTWLV